MPIEQFQPPQLLTSGSTALGRALQVLQQSLDADVKPAVKGEEKGDWKPLVFILTDGEPTDEWQTPRQEILNRQQRKVINVITVGCGPSMNEGNLKAIAIGETFRMDNSEASFKRFFQWVSQSVKAVSKAVSQPSGGDQPMAMHNPDPQVIQAVGRHPNPKPAHRGLFGKAFDIDDLALCQLRLAPVQRIHPPIRLCAPRSVPLSGVFDWADVNAVPPRCL